MNHLSKVLKDMLTGIDGESYDLVRVNGLISAVLPHVYIIKNNIMDGKPLDFQAYGIGMAAIYVAVGTALKLKESTEPPASSQPSKEV